CDCFGCCSFPTGANPGRHLFIGSKDASGNKLCTLEDARKANPEHCDECTPVTSCYAGCGECDLCLGKDTIPEHCIPGDRCADGGQPCGLPGDDPCNSGFYCITGCCVFFGAPPG